MTHEKEGDMISIHDILAFIEYEKYFRSVERAKEMKARAAIAAPAPDPASRVIRAGGGAMRSNP